MRINRRGGISTGTATKNAPHFNEEYFFWEKKYLKQLVSKLKSLKKED